MFLGELLFIFFLLFWLLNWFRIELFLEFFCFVFGCFMEFFVEVGMCKIFVFVLEWFGIVRFIK